MLLTLVTLLVAQVPDQPADFSAKISAIGTYQTNDPAPPVASFGPNVSFLLRRHTGANLTVSADVSVNMSSTAFSFIDNGSALSIDWTPPQGLVRSASATFFPFSLSRLRLGTIQSTTLSATRLATPLALANAHPGLALSARIAWAEPFLWIAYLPAFNNILREVEPQWAGVVGSAFEPLAGFRVQLAYVATQMGLVPGLANSGIEQRAWAHGAHGELSWQRGGMIARHVDFTLESGNPRIWDVFFQRDDTANAIAVNVGLEGNYLATHLEDPDVFGKMRDEPAMSAALYARARFGMAKVHAVLTDRNISFMQLGAPGFPPYKQFPKGTELIDERAGTLAAELALTGLHLRPGIRARITLPATFTGPTVLPTGGNPPGFSGPRTVVLRDVNIYNILPTGSPAVPTYELAATAVWEPVDALGFVAEVAWQHDPNVTTFKDDENGIAQPTFVPADRVRVNLLGQARF